MTNTENHKGGWGEPMGGCDSEGNPITVSFGWVLGLNNPICLTSAVLALFY